MFDDLEGESVDNLSISGTDRSPDIDFNFQDNVFEIRGMCYLENVGEFFKPILADFELHLESLNGADIVFNFRMSYFNSTSARQLVRILDKLDAAAERENTVTINWHHADDDDSMMEQGEDLGDDIAHARFEIIEFSDSDT